ncbi:GCN5-related N-acetyltransferase [uncultured Sphingopyxis sp.]|uniref:GCN5-related N-acetyltransferase n=1 Tax=uncultured Sphingopyxis sp. TaxID=310581 RepID=A0A1Y5PZR5_9SPHN|nr:GNAT family N-acetyltransferase [uncultured Sphingopyxis sp.]SBV34176.1 GCN5-related N-acetyltransferase [uncultured Sphingopyxis sp.]
MTDTLLALSTDHCRITPLLADDARALAAITDETVTSRVHFLPAPFTEADARALIAGSGGGDVFHAVRDASGLDLNGVIGVHRRPGGEYEIGYWFAARVRGKGVATEAVRAVVEALAASRPGSTIVAECHPDNERSRALLRRIGFVSTGRPGKRPGRMLMTWRAAPAWRIDVC